MRKSRTLDLGTGTFVVLGFAALLFLTTQTTSRGLSFASRPHYDLTAKFDNIGDLKVGAPVSMSGVEVGRVTKIAFDPKEYKAVVTLRLAAKYDQIPTDSDASIYTQGLLGGKFIGLTAGGADTYPKDKAKLDALVANVLLPNFDTEYSARLVLGQTWRTATADQRKRFVDAFYHSLLRNYGAALVNFTADRFVILPYRGDPGDTTATVRTEVKTASGDKVPVNFSSV